MAVRIMGQEIENETSHSTARIHVAIQKLLAAAKVLKV